MSHGHQVAKITFGSFSPPKVAGTNIWKTSLERQEDASKDFQENHLHVHQPEPKSFKPGRVKSSKLRRKVFDDDVNLQDRRSKFYNKLIDIKNQQKETLKLLDQLSKADQEFGRKINPNKELLQKEKQSKITDEELKKPLFDDLKLKKKDRVVEEILKRMWDNFEPEENVQKIIELEELEKVTRKSTRKWRPVVTVPEPFNMTVREERKLKDNLNKPEAGEAPEVEVFGHRHRAKSAPATTFVPLYDEMNERMRERREAVRENAVGVTAAMQRPFSFDKRDAENKMRKEGEIERMKREEEKKAKEMSKFRAKPVNMKVLDAKVYDRVEEEHLYRKIKGRLRKEELFFTASLPPRMKKNRQREVERRNEKMEKQRREREFSHAPQVTRMPDFEKLHRKEMRRKLMHETSREKREIVQKPFRLSAHERSRSSVTSSLSSLDCRQGRPSSAENYRRYEKAKENPIPTRTSEASRRRMECIRESLARAQVQIDKYKKSDVRRSDVTGEKLKREISYNMTQTDNDKEERAERNKKELVKRQKKYKKFLNDVQNRVDKRPLLLAQHDKKSDKTEAERRFNEIMKRESSLALRHDDEIVEQTSEVNVDENFEEISEKHEENIKELNNFETPLVSEAVGEKSEISDKNSEVSDKNSVVSEKNSVVSGKNSEVSDKNSGVSDKNSEVSEKNSEVSNVTSQFGECSEKISVKSEVKSYLEGNSVLETEQVEESVEEKEITEETEDESVIEEEKFLNETQSEESSEKIMDPV